MRQATLLIVVLLASCAKNESPKPPEPISLKYATYDDCILSNLRGGQASVAVEEVIAACRSKFPEKAGMFDDLIPEPSAGEGQG